jgi:methylated-DNA-protein-cysteine methyltransferase related protein
MTNPGPHHLHSLIYAVVRRIPRGRVATYGQVATLAGLPGHARLAGYAMFNLPAELAGEVPWQRVINARGEISYSESRRGNDFRQRELLEEEGVQFDARGRVNLRLCGWVPEEWAAHRVSAPKKPPKR